MYIEGGETALFLMEVKNMMELTINGQVYQFKFGMDF